MHKIIFVSNRNKVRYYTCSHATQEELEATLPENVGEEMLQADPVDKINNDSMPVPEEEENKEQDDKILITGQDVGQPASPAKEASTSDVVVTTIHKLITIVN